MNNPHLFKRSANRLPKLLELDAPEILMETEVALLVSTFGARRVFCRVVRGRLLMLRIKLAVYLADFWQCLTVR